MRFNALLSLTLLAVTCLPKAAYAIQACACLNDAETGQTKCIDQYGHEAPSCPAGAQSPTVTPSVQPAASPVPEPTEAECEDYVEPSAESVVAAVNSVVDCGTPEECLQRLRDLIRPYCRPYNGRPYCGVRDNCTNTARDVIRAACLQGPFECLSAHFCNHELVVVYIGSTPYIVDPERGTFKALDFDPKSPSGKTMLCDVMGITDPDQCNKCADYSSNGIEPFPNTDPKFCRASNLGGGAACLSCCTQTNNTCARTNGNPVDCAQRNDQCRAYCNEPKSPTTCSTFTNDVQTCYGCCYLSSGSFSASADREECLTSCREKEPGKRTFGQCGEESGGNENQCSACCQKFSELPPKGNCYHSNPELCSRMAFACRVRNSPCGLL